MQARLPRQVVLVAAAARLTALTAKMVEAVQQCFQIKVCNVMGIMNSNVGAFTPLRTQSLRDTKRRAKVAAAGASVDIGALVL